VTAAATPAVVPQEVAEELPSEVRGDTATVDSLPHPAQERQSTSQPELTARILPSTAPSGMPLSYTRPPQPRVAPRRVNPYLSNDPAQKARRLARALVSDLVAYNPQKREEGLRAGTLKELFRDEIRKSWQEYVEQVGAAIAESTPHFQEALNDVLAGGRRIF